MNFVVVGPHGESVSSVEHEVAVGLGGGLDDLRPGLRLPRPLPLQQQDHRRVREEDCRREGLFLDTADDMESIWDSETTVISNTM